MNANNDKHKNQLDDIDLENVDFELVEQPTPATKSPHLPPLQTQPPTTSFLPRYDLREPAFRRYERYIQRATERSYIINPREELNLSPNTFILRFRDAITGFKRYHYSSTIPKDFEFKRIRLRETDNGEVLVENILAPLPSAGVIPIGCRSDKPFDVFIDLQQIALAAEQVHLRHTTGPFYIRYKTQDEKQSVFNLSSNNETTTIPEAKGLGQYDIILDLLGDDMIVMRA